MTAECIPGQLRDDAMILVPVGKVMSHHQMRRNARTHRLECVFDVRAAKGEVAATKMMDIHRDVRAGAQQRRSGRARFALAYGIPGEYHPDESQVRMTLAQLDQRAATSDLDVIAVLAQTEDRAVR